jgi:acyl-CoA hydrolase
VSGFVPRARSASATEMLEYVLPQHANLYGTVFGGQIMAWVDLCAVVCAQRHASRPCVTAAIDALLFKRPVRVGQVVRLRAHITAAFRTSMEVEVSVLGEDTVTGEQWPTVECRATIVAISDDLKPAPVPPLLIESDAQREAHVAAEERRRARLARRERA